MVKEIVGARGVVDPKGRCGDGDGLFKSAVDGGDETPVSGEGLPVVLDGEALRRVRVFGPEAEIQEIHEENEIDGFLIFFLGMQRVLRPRLETVLLLLHEGPYGGSGSLGPVWVQSDVDGVVVHILSVLEDLVVCFS